MDPPLAVVTGGSRRIGRAFVLEAVRRGYRVLFSYRIREEDAGETVRQAAARAGLDVSSWPDATGIVVVLDGGRIM